MKTIKLCKGKGEEGVSHCVMAATSIVAGEPFSDHPSCVCPTITEVLIRINDYCPTDEIRERLLGHLPWLIIGTNGGPEVAAKRAKAFAAAYADAANVAAAVAAAATDATDAAAAVAFAALADAADAFAAAVAADADADAATIAVGVYNAATYDAAAHDAAIAAAAGATYAAWESKMRKFIQFLEEEIIPIHTTMVKERDYSGLILSNAE